MSCCSRSDKIYIEELLSKTRIEAVIIYDKRRWQVKAGIKQTWCLVPTHEILFWMVKITMMPFKRHERLFCFKAGTSPTKSLKVDNIIAYVLPQMSIRYRLYCKIGVFGRFMFIGETEVGLGSIFKKNVLVINEWRFLKGGKYCRNSENETLV